MIPPVISSHKLHTSGLIVGHNHFSVQVTSYTDVSKLGSNAMPANVLRPGKFGRLCEFSSIGYHDLANPAHMSHATALNVTFSKMQMRLP
jgi:hypothetical protein